MADDNTSHKWPSDNEHLFTTWMPKSKSTLYRVCIHPNCKHVEEKEAPK